METWPGAQDTLDALRYWGGGVNALDGIPLSSRGVNQSVVLRHGHPRPVLDGGSGTGSHVGTGRAATASRERGSFG